MVTRALEEVDFALDPLAGQELHRTLRAARGQGPLVRTRFFGRPAFLLTRYAEIRQYLSMEERFPGGDFYRGGIEPVVGPTFISMDGARHDTYRRLAMPAFRSRAAQRFVNDEVGPLAEELVERFAHRGAADLVAEYARVLPFWAISRKLGLPVGTEDDQRRWALDLLSHPASPERALEARRAVSGFLGPIIRERRRKPGDDVISQLLSGDGGGDQLTDSEIVSHVLLLYAVGATTTSDALSNLLRVVLTDREVLRLAMEQPGARPRLVTELLRFEPPVAVLPRTSPMDETFCDVEVPAGSVVLCGIASANRDDAQFAAPDRFDITRAEREILTFGFASKFCPGSHFARRQLLVALDALVAGLPKLRLVEASEPTGAILRRVEHVRAAWDGG